ncbi:MAG TPA: hypothetical protein P5307_19105, partial [Pirellulaceae bacterium]|nr:hypothetical protein [Pirellulaceae bacterium]
MRWKIPITFQAILLALLPACIVSAEGVTIYDESSVVDNGYYTGNCGGDCGLAEEVLKHPAVA